ncbi:MAG: DUF3310 domain-containing protein [Paludibacteraceae bacterium]|nr:DUF3310 domain-containing protein [Paludibacteraceae bacterium]
MENLKIRVNSEAESKEVQGLLEKLGFKKSVWGTYSDYFIFANSNYYSRDDISNFSECDYKEITLPELRDLVVLKRNDRNDRTHTDQDNWSWFISSNGTGYVFGAGNANGLHQWDESSLNMVDLKPIEKTEMKAKEYLNKETYAYVKTHDLVSKDSNWIEIPEWAVAYADHKNGHGFFYDSFCKIASFYNIAWSRHTLPEELPFIDDEPLQSLNDQYAEIEKVRQSAWQKQEGGNHYKNLKIQPMQYALENKLDYAQANVVKYVTRHKEKNGKEDLLKAIHNLELMIEFYYGDEK